MGHENHAQIIRGKRTKRQRLQSALGLAMAPSSSSSGGGDDSTGGTSCNDHSGGLDRATTSPATSTEVTGSTAEEEEDMANCLILLAQGHSRKVSEPVPTASNRATLYAYQCKTCNRCFPSFQALGGHRASHKKPKATPDEKKALMAAVDEEDYQFTNTSTVLSLQLTSRVLYSNTHKSKVHECSICGSEFSSGQALGGHMRRHRSFMNTATTMSVGIHSPETQEAKKQRKILQLDLNLPAPEDDHREPKFSLVSKEQVLVFSASPLVDCHY